jgi:hypothetical protein
MKPAINGPLAWAVSLLLLWVIGVFVLGAPLWEEAQDPRALLRLIHRLAVTAPVAVCMAILAVTAFDRFTPNDWMKKVSENETACSVVLASVILGVFWLCVQG